MDFSEGGATCSCSVPFVHALCSSQYLWIGYLVACALSYPGGSQSLRSPQLVINQLHLSHVQMSPQKQCKNAVYLNLVIGISPTCWYMFSMWCENFW